MTAFLLDNPVRHYAWGSRTVLPELLGLPVPAEEPWAEIWMGAHPDDPSRLPDGRTLAELEPDLPFLVKLLAAAEPLSIQAHPNVEQARAGYAAEEARGVPHGAPERSYHDRNHKPELLVALTRVEALCGFRDPAEMLRLVDLVGVPALSELARPLRATEVGPALQETFAALTGTPAADRRRLVHDVAAACRGREATSGPQDALALDWVARLAASYPGDPGVVAPLFLRLVVLQPGEAVFLDSGVLHAYLHGAGVEVQASSDNVLRGALTPKHVDVTELMRVVRFEVAPDPHVVPRPLAPGVDRYDVPVADFGVWRVDVSVAAAAGPVRLPGEGVCIVVCTAGALEVGGVPLSPGRAVFVPAGSGSTVTTGSGTCFVTAAGSAWAG